MSADSNEVFTIFQVIFHTPFPINSSWDTKNNEMKSSIPSEWVRVLRVLEGR